MDVLRRASLVWLELKKLEEELQLSDVELAEASGEGEAFSHQLVSHTGPCLHPGETLQSSIIISCHEKKTFINETLEIFLLPSHRLISQQRTKIPQFLDTNDFIQ